MGMMTSYQNRINGIVPDFRTTQEQGTQEKRSDFSVLFYGAHDHYCVGFVDMVNSTKISAKLNETKLCKYYSTFLNSTAAIVKRFGGIVVKNVGDSLLYYFPQKTNITDNSSFLNCLECSLALIDVRESINEHLAEEVLPELNYRISADYGKVMFAESENSYCVDIFGAPVNMCTKINHNARPNSVVVGGDLYEMVKKINHYSFQKISDYDIGFKNSYPVYTLSRKKNSKNSYKIPDTISQQYGESNIRSVQVGLAIKRVLTRMGNGELDTITDILQQKYQTDLFDCYSYPVQLKAILVDLYGNSYSAIVDQIEEEFGEFSNQLPYKDFLSVLRNGIK